MDRSELRPLTSARFFAAVAVLVYHATGGNAPDWLSIANSGYEAVSFFFLLSGFILCHVYSADGGVPINTSAGEFYWRRFLRVAPLYFLGLALAFPRLVYGYVSNGTAAESYWSALVLAPTFLQSWVPPAALAWNGPGWSLSVEMALYATFPILAPAITRLSLSWLVTLVVVALFVNTAVREMAFDLWSARRFSQDTVFPHYYPAFHLPAFIAGISLRLLMLRRPGQKWQTSALIAGLVTLVLALNFRPYLPWWTSTDMTLIPAYCLVVFGLARPDAQLKWMSSSHLALLGNASYALYITHAPLLFYWSKAWGDRTPASVVLFCVCAVAISVACHIYFDPWARSLMRRVSSVQ